MNYRKAHKKILAVKALLLEPSSTFSKAKSVSTLLRGIHKDTDAALDRFEAELATFEKIHNGEFVILGAEHLPENTEEEKKRKRALLLFLSTWNRLKSEVVRVEAELAASNEASNTAGKVTGWGRIFKGAKGPLGIITVAAVGIVITMQVTSVQLIIENEGCGTLVASAVPISLPGFSLPKEPISSGSSGVATLPPLVVSVDGTSGSVLSLKALTFSTKFELPNNITDILVNDVSLLGKAQDINLADKKSHILRLVCS